MFLARRSSIIALAVVCCGAARAGIDVWTPIGPQGAQLMSVVRDPSAEPIFTLLYATDLDGDIYRSNRAETATTWTRITPLQAPCVFYFPPSVVVQGDGTVYASTCNGLYKSADGGTSWTRRILDLTGNAQLTGDPTNPPVLYALGFDGTTRILFKTTDGTTTWSSIPINLPVVPIIQLLVDPTLPSRLYALASDSVYRSVDSGLTWSPVNTGLPSTALNSVAISGSTLFVGTGGFGVYKTDSGGATWTPANNGISTQSISLLRVGSGPTILYAAVDNGNSYQFFKSVDSGATWSPIATLDTRVGDFVVSRAVLYAATLSGLATSSDGGASWTFAINNGLANAAVPALYLIRTPEIFTPLIIYAPLFDGHGYLSDLREAQWSPLTLADGSPVEPIGINGATVYGENCPENSPSEACRIYRNANFGEDTDWTPLLSVSRARIAFMLDAPNVPGRLFAIGNQFDLAGSFAPLVLRSEDDGIHWNEVDSGLPAGPLSAIAMDPTNSNVLYAGAGNRVYKTTNAGDLWVNASGGLPESSVNALAVSPAHPNTLFAGLGNPQSTPDVYGLYRSDDGGNTWSPRNPAFVNLAITALIFDRNNSSNVYAGTGGGGLFRSTDGGATWKPINNGLSNAASLVVDAIAVDSANGPKLFIGTFAGVFALTINQYDSFVSVIEFYNYILDHYFIASELQADVPALDSGAFPGWIRTGQAFRGYPQATGAAQPVCRFYIPPQHGDSHFYSASLSECAAVLDASTDPANPAYPNYSGYKYETAAAFYIDVPLVGLCPSGEVAVYRLWNRRFDSNHRYTTDPAIRDAMVAKGYVLEGVVMCALL